MFEKYYTKHKLISSMLFNSSFGQFSYLFKKIKQFKKFLQIIFLFDQSMLEFKFSYLCVVLGTTKATFLLSQLKWLVKVTGFCASSWGNCWCNKIRNYVSLNVSTSLSQFLQLMVVIISQVNTYCCNGLDRNIKLPRSIS